MVIDFLDIVVLGRQIQTLEEDYKEIAEFELAGCLRTAPNNEMMLKESVLVECWNRRYSFNVKKLRLRQSDESVMIVGDYFGKEDIEEEFFSYIWNFKDMKRIVDQIIP